MTISGSADGGAAPTGLRGVVACAHPAATFAAFAVGYVALSGYGAWLARTMVVGTGLWLATGWTAAALILLPRRRWLAVLVAAAVVETLTVVAIGAPPAALVWWVLAAVIAPVSGVLVLGWWTRPSPTLARLRDVLGFAVTVVLGTPVIGATVGSLGASAAGATPADVWPQYLLGTALGVLGVTPVLVSWDVPGPRRHLLEVGAISAALVAAVVVSFAQIGPFTGPTFYLVVPPLAWAAVRAGVRGTAVAVAAVVHLANLITGAGYGPFATAAPGNDPLAMQLFLLVIATTALAVAALTDDLADRIEVERLLRHRAAHDPLTDLPNRPHVTDHLARRLDAPDGRVAVVLGDVDRLKQVNEDHGQGAGDEVLRLLGERLRRTVGDRGLVGRWSGDQFLIVLDEQRVDAVELADEIGAATRVPLTVGDDVRTVMTLCLGVVGHGDATDVHDLIARADLALDRAKERGPGSRWVFDRVLHGQVRDRRFIERDLGPAIDRGDLHCVYQPEVDLRSRELVALECLCRWEHPHEGMIAPDRFVPVAEATGDIHAMFALVLDRALAAQRDWAARLGTRPIVAVNLSARQLDDRRLPAIVDRSLVRAGASTDDLWLEVTETALADDPDQAVLTDLHELGVRLAIDDFGTGWSSMVRLSSFPWDALKIDRRFVAQLGQQRGAAHVVRASIDLAHALGMRAIAEGVETAEQAAVLADLGCDIAQGYHFARPLPAREVASSVDATGRWQR